MNALELGSLGVTSIHVLRKNNVKRKHCVAHQEQVNKNDTKLDMDLNWTNSSPHRSNCYGLLSSNSLCFKGGHAELSNQLRLKLMAGLLLLFVMMPMAYAVTPVFFDGYAVFPSKGDSQTNILAVIRPDKRTDNKPMWLYIFWDDVPIIRRQMDNMDGTVHTYIWDVTFQPPQDPQYLARGDHTITIWVEDYDGDIKMGVYNFKITEIIPYPEWFEQLSDSAFEALRGPKGDKGDTGATGPRGLTGPQGETGLWGPQGIQGVQGNIGPQGENGTQGEPGPQGEQGPIGPAGDTTQLSATLLLTNIAISLVAAAISVYTYRKFKT